MAKIAIVQEAPVVLDRAATLDKAVGLVRQAAADGAEMVVFAETFIPGYPAWIWRLRPGNDWGLNEAIHARLLAESVDVTAGDLDPLADVARELGVTVICGVNERAGDLSRATLFNSVVVIGTDGALQVHHRKLMPTNPERMVWGQGDAAGLKVVDTPCGRVGALICWENYMPLARFALYAQGVELYIAPTYDSGDGWLGTLQHIAREGRCWVLGAGTILEASDMPADLPGREQLYPDAGEWVNGGDSVVIDPSGEIVAGPLRNAKGILYAEVDPVQARNAKRTLDVTGHYARPDIFTLQVNTERQSPVQFD